LNRENEADLAGARNRERLPAERGQECCIADQRDGLVDLARSNTLLTFPEGSRQIGRLGEGIGQRLAGGRAICDAQCLGRAGKVAKDALDSLVNLAEHPQALAQYA